MTSPAAPVAVLLPCHNSRHRLWRSLAAVAAQTAPPAQILVLDRGSADGTADWLRVRWPGVEFRSLPPDADAAAVGKTLAAAISAPSVAVLHPGRYWRRSHLESLLAQPGAPGLHTPVDVAATLTWPADDEPAPSSLALAEALESLPATGSAILLDLRAAGSPAGLLDLLGLAAALGPRGRRLHAWTLADLAWPALEAIPASAPLLVSLAGALDLSRASEQLCIEELLRRLPDRPLRLLPGGIAPSSPQLLSRLLEAVLSHRDCELWVGDTVSRRLALALLGRERVRLVPPPLLALAPILSQLHARELIRPAMLGRPEGNYDLDRRLGDHAALWAGFDQAPVRRLALALARVTGIGPWLKGQLLQHSWSVALVAWAAARDGAAPPTTVEPETAIFAAMCGQKVTLAPITAKQRDLVATWRAELHALGVETP